MAPRVLAKDSKHMNKSVERIIDQEGEGAVLRKVASLYIPGRSTSLFKLKVFILILFILHIFHINLCFIECSSGPRRHCREIIYRQICATKTVFIHFISK